jgi:hypothetical protein
MFLTLKFESYENSNFAQAFFFCINQILLKQVFAKNNTKSILTYGV